MIRDDCKVCSITLRHYEIEEYKDLCIECFREQYNLPKKKETIVHVRLRNRKYFYQ